MAYVDYSSHWVLDTFLTYLESNQLGANDEHLYDTFAVEHNINTSTIDGTHKSNSITGSMINTTPASTGSQAIAGGGGATWTPAVGVYQIVDEAGGSIANFILQIYISGAWRGSFGGVDSGAGARPSGIIFFDGTNMRLANATSGIQTVWYQKF